MKEFFDTLIRAALADQVHDFHLKAGQPPIRRSAGKIKRTGDPALTIKELDQIVSGLLLPAELDRLQRLGSVDLIYCNPGEFRARVNVCFQMGTLALSIRLIPAVLPNLKTLGLPPEVQQMLLGIQSGLVLFTGPANSGKSTTLNALLMEICAARSVNVVTVEDPIEFVFPRFPQSVVHQREVGVDTRGLVEGVKAAVRHSPDILMIGELRTPEGIFAALEAAETGCLVVSTLHTRTVVQTISRLINVFPGYQIEGVRQMLANCLRMVLSQALFPAAGKKGAALAFEVLPVQSAVPKLIRTNRLHEIPNVLKTGSKFGCISMAGSIDYLVKSNRVHPADIPPEYQAQKISGEA